MQDDEVVESRCENKCKDFVYDWLDSSFLHRHQAHIYTLS